MYFRWRKSTGKAGPRRGGGTTPAPEDPIDERTRERPPHHVVAGMATDVGCRRTLNEDTVHYVHPTDADQLRHKGVLMIVADGMGGHEAGEVASRMAVDVVSRDYYASTREAPAALQDAFRAANQTIHEASHRDGTLRGMGTTCTALVLRERTAVLAHVGDSRLYLIRQGDIYTMSPDHSFVGELVRRGMLTREQARRHNDKHLVLRVLGTQPDVDVASWPKPFHVHPGDHFLLCSDGLHDLVEDEEILQAVSSNAPDAACDALVRLARQRGGYDNVSVGVLRIDAGDDPARNEPPRTPREANTH